MRKLILSTAFDLPDDIHVGIVKLPRYGSKQAALGKRAALFSDQIGRFEANPDTSVLHLIAMGASDTYGPNKNADGYRREWLTKKHATFVDHGKVYKEHDSRPEVASGTIKLSAYNEPMDRVELLVEVDGKKWAKELTSIENGEDITFSMGCNVPYDECVVCHNQAKSPREYCKCMKEARLQTLDDGKLVYVDNPDPDFYDISGVVRPADRTAFLIRKVAASQPLTGAELAELMLPAADDLPFIGSCRKFSKIKIAEKLAEIKKRVECTPAGVMQDTVLKMENLDDPELKKLNKEFIKDASAVMRGLAHRQMLLTPGAFVVVAGDGMPAPEGFEKFANDLSAFQIDEIVGDGTYDVGTSFSHKESAELRGALDALAPVYSLSDCHAKFRLRPAVKEADLHEPDDIHSINNARGLQSLALEYARYKIAALEAIGGEFELRVAALR